MIYFGFTESLKRWKELLLSALELGIVMFLLVIVITTLMEPFRRYLPFKEFLEGDGICVGFDNDVNELYTEDDIEELVSTMHKVDKYMVSWEGGFVWNETDQYIGCFAYDERIGSYHPALSEGSWYTDVKTEEGVLNAVVTDDSLGLHAGDTLEVDVNGKIKVSICGVIADGGAFYYPWTWNREDSVFDMYKLTPKNGDTTIMGILLFSKKDADKVGLTNRISSRVFFHYENGITDDEMLENKIILAKNGMIMNADMKHIRERSFTQLSQKIMVILPVAIAAAILVSFSLACFAAIRTMSQLRTCGIFYSCGMQWSGCLWMNVVHTLLCCILGYGIMKMAHNLMILSGIGKSILFDLGKWQIIGCLVVMGYSILLTCLFPAFLIKKYQPVDVLRNTKL